MVGLSNGMKEEGWVRMEMKEEKKGLLNEIRVLDLADEKASFCSRLLVDMGASVIKVERPGGDSSRKVGPFLGNSPHPERSLFFYYHNTNKRGITLNIEHPMGKEIFLRLIKRADIVVETFPPGYLEKLRLDFEILKETNPKLILVSVTGFGQKGPRSQYKSCNLVASAFGGQMYVSGSPSGPPLESFGGQSYYIASLFAAISILLALRKRVQSGKGEHIDISSQEAVASTLDHVLVRYFYDRIIPKRQGNLSWDHSSFILPCKDGHFHLTISTGWETLIEWIASEGMAEDLVNEKWKDEEFRLRNVDHVIDILKRWTQTHSSQELFELGQLIRFPWAPVYSPEQVFENPQLKRRDFFIDVDHPEIGTSFKYPGSPFQLSSTSLDRRKRAPLIGEDNVQIYQKELGLSNEELQRLYSLSVI
jgi:crotonobetainyl-CoA:carnitine CoA-transferase CaiB-like acyl-CoA transferase